MTREEAEAIYDLGKEAVVAILLKMDEWSLQKTHQTGHPSRLHPATKNAQHPATYDGDDSAIFE